MNKKSDVIDNTDKEVNLGELEEQRNKEIIIGELLLLKGNKIKLISRAKKTLINRQNELQKINEGICNVQGHTYSSWIPHSGLNDITWYYSRVCQICNITDIKEITDDAPAKVLKKENNAK